MNAGHFVVQLRDVVRASVRDRAFTCQSLGEEVMMAQVRFFQPFHRRLIWSLLQGIDAGLWIDEKKYKVFAVHCSDALFEARLRD